MIHITCPTCSQQFERRQNAINRVIKKTGYWRCQSCAVSQKNKSLGKAAGTERLKDGFVEVRTADGWKRRSRLMIEEKIGRKLNHSDRVIHRNGINTDDVDDNLELLTAAEYNRRMHAGRKRDEDALKNMREARKYRRGVKLSPAVAASVRIAVASGVCTQADMARHHRVGKMAINRIVHRKAWAK